MNTFLAILALLVSSGLLYVNYRSLVERRHAEIVLRKEQILLAMSNAQHRFVSMLTQGEVVRFELRRLPDSERKFTAIEKLPEVLKRVSASKTNIDKSIEQLKNLDSRKMNRSDILLDLQTLTAQSEQLTGFAKVAEDEMLKLLIRVREEIKA